jgi:hypothetical protein
MTSHLVKLSKTQTHFLSAAIGRERAGHPSIIAPGTRWQTIRSLRRLGLLARNSETQGLYLTEEGLDVARVIRDENPISIEVRRPS